MRLSYAQIWNSLKAAWKWLRKVVKTVLRFFNLLEPDVPYMVLSLSKLSVWLTLMLTVFVVYTERGMAELGSALIANIGAIGNYAYRRRMQVRTRTGGYGYSQHQTDDTFGADDFADSLPSSDIEEEPLP